MRENPKVGDLVRVREWDDMKAEFGTRGNTEFINMRTLFLPGMKYMCGREFTVTGTDGWYIKGHGTGWLITRDMVQPVDDTEIIDTSVVDSFLCELGGM